MYSGKKIIILDGKIGFGKSYLLNILKKNTDILCIDLDKVVHALMSKSRREEFIHKHGIQALESYLYPEIYRKVLEKIYKYNGNTVCIEGIKALTMFHIEQDVIIHFNVPKHIRKKRVLERGDSLEKFEYFERLQS